MATARSEFDRQRNIIKNGDEPMPEIISDWGDETFADHRQKIDEIVRDYAEFACSSVEKCVEQYEKNFDKLATETQKDIVKKSKVFVNIEAEDFRHVLEDKRFKNQFETMDSNGLYNPKKRKAFEEWALGVSPNTPAKYRPIYGWWATSDKMASETKENVSYYGDIIVEFKPSIKKRTTYASYDTLGLMPRKTSIWGADITGRYSLSRRTAEYLVENRMDKAHWFKPTEYSAFKNYGYAETQIRGGAGLHEVSKVFIPSAKGLTEYWGAIYDEMARRAKATGLKVVRYNKYGAFKPFGGK